MDILWTAIVLEQPSIRKLVGSMHRHGGLVHSRIHCHHVTLTYGENELPNLLGETINMRVVRYVVDKKGECVEVSLDNFDWPYACGRYPHVTISCAEGVSAAHSNDMLAHDDRPTEADWDISMPETRLVGVVKACTQNGWVNLEQ